MAKRTMHFRSKEAYRKWTAYGHMRTKTGKLARSRRQSVFATTPGHTPVYIRGKRHRPRHRGIVGHLVR
jgi:hypothetical protein